HALRERPGYLPALRGLGELYLRQERFADLDWLITSSEGSGQGDQAWLETIVLRARRHLATKELDKARQALEHAIDRAPREPFLWRLLSHALLQQGKDGDYAEMALRRILELDPNCEEARNNLAVLLRMSNAMTRGD